MFARNGRSEKRDDDDGEEGDDEEEDGEVEEVDLADDAGAVVVLAAGWGAVAEVQPHADDSHHQPHHQPPECPLCGQHPARDGARDLENKTWWRERARERDTHTDRDRDRQTDRQRTGTFFIKTCLRRLFTGKGKQAYNLRESQKVRRRRDRDREDRRAGEVGRES